MVLRLGFTEANWYWPAKVQVVPPEFFNVTLKVAGCPATIVGDTLWLTNVAPSPELPLELAAGWFDCVVEAVESVDDEAEPPAPPPNPPLAAPTFLFEPFPRFVLAVVPLPIPEPELTGIAGPATSMLTKGLEAPPVDDGL